MRLEAHEPPEERGVGRDDVAMLVATRHDCGIVHARFRELPKFLSAGDLLVVNTSATLPAALDARLGEQQVELWLSTPQRDGTWLVELRTSDRAPYLRPPVGDRLDLLGGGRVQLLARFAASERLSVARFELDEPLQHYLLRHGRPIRYGYVPDRWPLDTYQTVFALQPGSAEMPSAGRPFTAELVTDSSRAAFSSRRSRSTRVSRLSSTASSPSPNASGSRVRLPSSSTPSAVGAAA